MTDQNYALIYKWILGNSFAGFGIFVAWQQDWLALVLASDQSYLSLVIAALFLVFWIASTSRAVTLDRESKRFRDAASQGIAADYMAKVRRLAETSGCARVDQTTLGNTLQARMLLAIQPINFVANLLILLGLVGTVIGFVIAVSGLGDSLVDHDNTEQVRAVLAQIVNGMGVALFTTLVGSILGGIWLQVHYHLLFSATAGLALDIVERAELDLYRDQTDPSEDTGPGADEQWQAGAGSLNASEAAGS